MLAVHITDFSSICSPLTERIQSKLASEFRPELCDFFIKTWPFNENICNRQHEGFRSHSIVPAPADWISIYGHVFKRSSEESEWTFLWGACASLRGSSSLVTGAQHCTERSLQLISRGVARYKHADDEQLAELNSPIGMWINSCRCRENQYVVQNGIHFLPNGNYFSSVAQQSVFSQIDRMPALLAIIFAARLSPSSAFLARLPKESRPFIRWS